MKEEEGGGGGSGEKLRGVQQSEGILFKVSRWRKGVKKKRKKEKKKRRYITV